MKVTEFNVMVKKYTLKELCNLLSEEKESTIYFNLKETKGHIKKFKPSLDSEIVVEIWEPKDNANRR